MLAIQIEVICFQTVFVLRSFQQGCLFLKCQHGRCHAREHFNAVPRCLEFWR